MTAELSVYAPGRFAAKLTRMDLHRLWMQRFSENLPWVKHAVAPAERATFAFRTEPGSALLWSGMEMLRRLNLARQALHLADAARTTVTQIAADFGFWRFGRFAFEYRELFGETPSATLRGQRR